ncbi:MAG TPA: hypothetical protein VK666_22430 [Chryseolinea sp.]|nr:hypothetical protein [Chryseolinea sp.]
MARRKKQNEDEPQENAENADDSFGLPEIDYEPLKRDVPADEVIKEETVTSTTETTVTPPAEPPLEIPAPPVQERRKEEFAEENAYYEPSYSYSYEEESPSIWPKVLGIILLLAVVGGAIWYFSSYRPNQLAMEARKNRERLALQEAEEHKRLTEDSLREQEEARKRAAALPAEKPATGTIETLSGRSGRYYVVVASSIDGDLIMDYAKKLSVKGVTSKIIPPFGKVKFHRLTIAEGDTYANAQATADGMKGGDYGNKLWVIKY